MLEVYQISKAKTLGLVPARRWWRNKSNPIDSASVTTRWIKDIIQRGVVLSGGVCKVVSVSPWTEAERESLRYGIDMYGSGEWSAIAGLFCSRTAEQVCDYS
jgi:hypothetical protein